MALASRPVGLPRGEFAEQRRACPLSGDREFASLSEVLEKTKVITSPEFISIVAPHLII